MVVNRAREFERPQPGFVGDWYWNFILKDSRTPSVGAATALAIKVSEAPVMHHQIRTDLDN